jgi:hypothetical protein
MAAKKRDYSPYKKLLEALRDRLRGDVRTISDAALLSGSDAEGDVSHVPTHLADKGTEAYLQEFDLSMVENGRRNISLDNLVSLTLALKVDLGELLVTSDSPAAE